MTIQEAKKFAESIVAQAEKQGIDHHSVEECKKGNQRYIEVKVSIKITA